MEEKTKKPKKENSAVEREYVIPLREKCRSVPRYRKANKAIKSVKEFLARHMKIRDGDLKKVKLDRYLNEAIWARGIKKPLAKVKVKVKKEGENVFAELFDLPTKLKFKKAREEKREQVAKESVKKKKVEKAEEGAKTDVEEKEKEASVAEEGEKLEKKKARELKHEVKGKTPSQQERDETTTNKSY